jgi:MFS transporter, DHA1 family, multidrug resistance protein
MTVDHPGQTADAHAAADAFTSSPPPRLGLLMLLTALAVLPVNIILPSLPNIAASFGADFALVNLAVACYAIVTALIEIVASAVSDRYGRRPVALTALVLFIVASIGCTFAPNICVFLVFRAMQAFIAACFSIALVMIKETSDGRRTASTIGYLAMGWAIAPMVGPVVGGMLDEAFGWRAVFAALAIAGTIVFVLSARSLKETAAISSRPKTNYLESYRHLLGSARFWAYAMCMACSMGTLYIFLGGAPLVVGTLLGGSSAVLGFYLGLVPAGFILGSWLTGRYASRLPPGATLIVARLATCLGLSIGLCLSLIGVINIPWFFVCCMFIGIGNGLTMPVAKTAILSVRADHTGTAAGLAAAMTIGGGALIVSIAGLFVTMHGAFRTLFIMMLITASIALLAAIWAASIDRRDPLPPLA